MKEFTHAGALGGVSASSISGGILSVPTMNAHNDVTTPNAIAPAAFTVAGIGGTTLTVALPSNRS